MRLVLAALLLTTACSKKPAPQSPANAAPVERAQDEDKDKDETGATNANTPDQPDDAPKDMKSDPCDGSE